MANLFKNHKGLGDTVEAITTATGIKAIVKAGSKAFNKPCGWMKEKNFKRFISLWQQKVKQKRKEVTRFVLQV